MTRCHRDLNRRIILPDFGISRFINFVETITALEG
jgi:hypothetical protein